MAEPAMLVQASRLLRRAGSALRLRRVDRRPLPPRAGEIRLFVLVRDERLRLPYFYAYYRGLGIRHFFAVDNGSSDGTLDFLREQPDTFVWRTGEPYDRQEFWVDVLLRRHGAGGWCLVVDADELLVYPHQERLPLDRFCDALDAQRAEALHTVLLDLYPDGPLRDTVYRPGEPFLSTAPFFEAATLVRRPFVFRDCQTPFPFRFAGGVRRRVFGLDNFCCTKFPLLRYRRGLYLTRGAHAVEGARIASVRGGLLHFKFLSDFAERAGLEAARGAHWQGAIQYRAYDRALRGETALTLRGPDSLRYENTDQLLRLGLLQSSPDLEAAAAAAPGAP